MTGEHTDDEDSRRVDLDTSAVRLLSTVPSGFVAERKRLAAVAEEQGDHAAAVAILALRKPSMAAWSLNLLAARRPELLTELARLGSALGAAQEAGDATSLRTLGTERRTLVAALVAATTAATAEQGSVLSSGVVEAVRQSIQAASADADVQAQLASGRLTDALTPSGAGWGGAGGGPAHQGEHGDRAATGDHAATGEADDDRRRRLRPRLEAAEQEAEGAAGLSADADDLLAESTARHAELVRDRDDLARRLDELESDLADAARERARREREALRAQRASEAAREAAERLREALSD